MSRFDKLALVLAILSFLAAAWVSIFVFDGMAHLEDEMALVWQARVIAKGELTLPTPEHPKSFLVPFVVDHQGQRFGKYPLGWPALLSFGERFGAKQMVNPLLAGLAVWLTYLLGKRILDEKTGLLSAGLTVLSPFFLLNSGSLLTHPLGLVLSAAFALMWLDNFWGEDPRWGLSILGGLTLGVLFLTRPLTAVAVAFPFLIHGIIILWRGPNQTRKHLLLVGVVTLLVGSLQLLWQAYPAGDPFQNLYTLWWDYDRYGFGKGYGPYNHNLNLAYLITWYSLKSGSYDLFGWWSLSYFFLPFGLWVVRRNRQAWLAAGVFPALVLLYSAYWIGSTLFGPRYYYEGLYSLTILTAAGILRLGGWGQRSGKYLKARRLGTTAVLLLLVFSNLFAYLPLRLKTMQGLYGIQREMLAPFQTEEAQALAPALFIVHADWWTEYGGLLELQDPSLDQPLLFAYSQNRVNDAELTITYVTKGRSVYHYYPDEPDTFYTTPRP